MSTSKLVLVIVAVAFSLVSTTWASTISGELGDGNPSITYDDATGEMTVEADGVSGIDSFIIASASGILTGDTPAFFAYGGFLTDTDNEISHMFFGPAMVGTDVKSLGNVAATDQTEAFLLSDLTLLGGISGSDSIEFDLVYVPEPMTMSLLALGGLALLRRRRRK